MLRRKGVDRDEFPKADNSLSKMHDYSWVCKVHVKASKGFFEDSLESVFIYVYCIHLDLEFIDFNDIIYMITCDHYKTFMKIHPRHSHGVITVRQLNCYKSYVFIRVCHKASQWLLGTHGA